MSQYQVTIRGQFEYKSNVEADSPEEAQGWAEYDLDAVIGEADVVMINSVDVQAKDTQPQQPGAIEGEER